MRLRYVPLSSCPDRSGFTCGDDALDRWFHVQAGQDVRCGYATVTVALAEDRDEIVGFHALSAASFPLMRLPSDMARRLRLPRYDDVPAIRLGRIAVAASLQGGGIGAALLLDAVIRALDLELAWAFIVVDAKNDRAARFYERFAFQRFPEPPLSLWLSRQLAGAVAGRKQDSQGEDGQAAVAPGERGVGSDR